jgi:hypothetical protein
VTASSVVTLIALEGPTPTEFEAAMEQVYVVEGLKRSTLISTTVAFKVRSMTSSPLLRQVRVYEMISPFCMDSSGALQLHTRLVISTMMEKLTGRPLGAAPMVVKFRTVVGFERTEFEDTILK